MNKLGNGFSDSATAGSPPDERCEICGCYTCADPWRCREASERLEWLEQEAEREEVEVRE